MMTHVNLIDCFELLNSIPMNKNATFYVLASILDPPVVSWLEKPTLGHLSHAPGEATP